MDLQILANNYYYYRDMQSNKFMKYEWTEVTNDIV